MRAIAAAFRVAYNKHVRRRSLSQQGLMPGWVERGGGSHSKDHFGDALEYEIQKRRRARDGNDDTRHDPA